MQVQRAQGTEDLFGRRMRCWRNMQAVAESIFEPHGFDMIETPAMEQLNTFVHGIGESTDVVRKEMFRVFSGALLEGIFEAGSEAHLKPRQRLALRPEGTAGVVRSVVENNFVPQGSSPAKLWYALPMFRGERPQKGRLRQFHQIGVEWIGTQDPASDAEAIMMLMDFFADLGFAEEDLVLRINSMGDAACRPAYRESVKAFILDHADDMCEDCKQRAELNPLRAFDCKNPHCQEIMKEAPLVDSSLCDDCQSHYAKVKHYLDMFGVSYIEDPTLVRGLDYYTRTVFEVECTKSDVGAIGGGGRYDGLVEICGGKPTPAVGFAIGFERTLLALEDLGIDIAGGEPQCIYIACADTALRDEVVSMAYALRSIGLRTEYDYQDRSLKSQFKQADKLNAELCVIFGPDEYERKEVTVRDMESHEQVAVSIDNLVEYIVYGTTGENDIEIIED